MTYRTLVISISACLALFSACQTSTYGTMVCGNVYMADGTLQTIDGNNRLKIPERSGKLVVVRNAYSKHSEKTRLRYADIDSIKIWHPASPEDVWTMQKMPAYGWCMRYVDNRHIRVLTQSSKGYGLFASGRAANFYTRRIFSKSKIHFIIAKPGMPAVDIGGTAGYGSKRWREQICSFVADDPQLCLQIMQSRRRKFEILRLLSQYKPNQ